MAPLSSVARLAGVGQGSLYRHFPDRMALAVAVFDDNVTDLESVSADPEAALADLFDRVSEQAMASTALIDMISLEIGDVRAQRLATRVSEVAEVLLARDQERGTIGRRVETADVMLAISMLAFLLARTPAAERAQTASRARAILWASFAAPSLQGKTETH